MSEDTSTATEFLADHPRLIGALFAILLALTQAGSAVGAHTITRGP